MMINGPGELEAAFAAMAQDRPDAVIVQPSLGLKRPTELALQYRILAVSIFESSPKKAGCSAIPPSTPTYTDGPPRLWTKFCPAPDDLFDPFDAMSARDRECKGGAGKFCRERELAVNERRQALDTAMQAVGQTADPQTDAAIRIVAWATHGALQPTGNDFAMLRLVLLALLPQIGGILLMVGRPPAPFQALYNRR